MKNKISSSDPTGRSLKPSPIYTENSSIYTVPPQNKEDKEHLSVTIEGLSMTPYPITLSDGSIRYLARGEKLTLPYKEIWSQRLERAVNKGMIARVA